MGELGLLGENYELLHGYIIEKMPKSPLHECISQKLLMILFKSAPSTFTVRPERPLSIGDSEPEPDISVVRGVPDDWRNSHPSTAELVVEISISSVDADLKKAEIYASANVPEYWLVRAEDCEIDVFRNPVGGRYDVKETVRAGDTLVSSAIEGISVVVTDLFAVGK